MSSLVPVRWRSGTLSVVRPVLDMGALSGGADGEPHTFERQFCLLPLLRRGIWSRTY